MSQKPRCPKCEKAMRTCYIKMRGTWETTDIFHCRDCNETVHQKRL